MSRRTSELEPLAQRWREAADRSEPALDLDRSRERLLVAQRQLSAASRARPSWWAISAAAAVVAVLIGVAFGAYRFAGQSGGPEPGAWVQTGENERLPVEFSEGSRVVLEPRSRVRVATVDPRGARMVLERGMVSATIVHRGDTRWSFDAGPFTVRVTGTELSVSWDPATEQFELEVQAGSVVVSGPLVEAGRTVRSGQRCEVRVRQASLEVSHVTRRSPQAPSYEVTELPVLAPSTAPEPDAPEPRARSDRFSWQKLERQGKYAEAMRAADHVGLDQIYATAPAEELMALARTARLAGHADASARALRSCRVRFAGTTHAGTAAYLLGMSASPAAAATWFSTYLSEQPGGPLAREAAGRLIESHQRAGNAAAARDAAQSYLSRYPAGPHASFARKVLGQPGD